MSDDDVEMVDVINTPSGSEASPAADIANDESMDASTDIPNQKNTELDAATRVEALCSLDEQIASILLKGSTLLETLAEGKLAGDKEAKKEAFKTALIEYNQLVQEVNGKLRSEVKMWHEASHFKLLPLNIPVKTSRLGEEKENILFTSLKELS